jgi:hypothetical protein
MENNKINIPKTFQIFGLTFKVTQPWKFKGDHWGECSIAKKSIKVKRSLNQEQKEITYLHEITHAILDCLEYNDLSHDEDFVERFSKALHQVIKTSK